MNRHFTLSKALSAILLFIGIALGQSAFAQTTWSLQPTSSGNTITYKVKRSGDISQAVTVRYRTVGLSSYEGENFTSANGTLTFPAGIDQQTVTVTSQTPSTEAYKYYQSGATRKYLFEVTDMGGFTLVSKEDNAGAGTVFNTSYLNQSVTDLVYFTYNGAIQSGDGNKYVDASHSRSSDWVQVTDGGYKQAVHTISTNGLYNNNSTSNSFRSYLNEIGYNMYATVYFTQKEEQDGYQYIQILADNSSTYDGDDPDGAVNAPSTSIYKASFILSYDPSGSVMSDPHYQFFPHRYNYVDRAAEQTAGISHYEFDYDNSHLYQQRFKATSYQSNTSGSLVLAPTVNNLNVRFDAAGSGGDTWDFKNLKVRLALVDATKPKIRNNNDIRVADGAYGYGNTVYITIPFTEIVTVTGSPTLSTTWGTLNYVAGSGTNVLTFSGHIEADLGTVLTVNSIGGTSFTIKDLMGNTYNSTSINKTYSGLQVTNPWAGDGSANDPYIIMDRYQLDLLSKLVWAGNYYENKYFKLGANITYSSSTSWSSTSSFTSNFTSIGGWGHSFRGVFDGDGHSISGIRIYTSGTTDNDQCQGLFGYASSATVKNLVLYDANIVGYKQVGAIAGSQTYGTFQDCYIYNTRVAATSGTQQEVIAGSISGGTRDRIYFKNCKIGNNTGQHNIVKLTLTNEATVSRTPVTTVNSTLTTYSDGATISGEEYYSPDATITLGYSSSVSSGSFVKYTASTSSGDITYTNIDGNVLTMPDADVTVSAAILPVVDYLDADGNAQQCSDYTLITSSNSNVSYGASGKTHWYVVSSDATITAELEFNDATANIILCNGATLNVNRTDSGTAVVAQGLNIFGQANGTGTLNVTASNGSSLRSHDLGIYGGIVSASGGDYGINAGGNSITLGYTAATNRITASSYYCSSLTVKAGQTLTDGEGHIYSGTYTGNDLNSTLTAMATKTLQPAYSITLPANFTVTGTTAAQGYAPAGEVVTLHTDEGYTITGASYTPAGGSATTINPVEGVWSFTMPAANTTVSATRVVNTYTVHFDANATNGINAAGTMTDQTFTYNEAQSLTANTFARTGYTFDGWNTAADGTGTAYTNQQSVSNLTNVLNGVVTLYAQWTLINWTGGGTSESDPYLIIYASQLVKLADNVNGGEYYVGEYFKLGNDIDMSGVAFDGIGTGDDINHSFNGNFNGDGKTISNVTIHKDNSSFVGFFGKVFGGTIKNFILDGVSITGKNRVGVLMGYSISCNIENCLVMNSNATNNNNNETGVICGFYDNSNFTNNHYRNCTITNINDTYTTNIGTTNGDVAGARSIHTLALPEHVTAASADMLTYDNVTYYASNVEVTLTPAQGITLADVTVNGVAATHQQDETWTFTMPAADATVTCTSSVPYIDADGNQQTCSSYTVIESSNSSVQFGTNGQDGWYVVSGNVTITGQLWLKGTNNHLILCDGALLTINHAKQNVEGLYVANNLYIYGQSAGSGTATITITSPGTYGIKTFSGNITINGGIISATSGTQSGIVASSGSITVNRGSVTAHGRNNGINGVGIIINGGIVNATNGEGSGYSGIRASQDITLGFTNLTDRITASSYKADNGTISVKTDQALYDGTAVAYSGTLTNTQINAIAGKTLEPCFILTLPAHVNATGVISQDGTTAYALAGNEITLTVTEGYEITSGAASLTMPTHNVVSDVTVQAIAYSISYDLAGGSVSTANPTEYTIETPDITLNNPTRPQFTFAGWTGTDLSEATLNVTIAQGSTGPRSYTANWEADIAENWGNGDGSLEAPYVITTTQGLDLLATLVNEGNTYEGKYFELGNDIDYVSNTTANYTAIGTQTRAFAGTFDGKGYAVKNFHIESNTGYQGLFGHVAESGTVKNVVVDNAVINDNAGIRDAGIVGLNWGSVENCLVINTVISGSWPEPIAGFDGTITNSYYRNCTVGNWANKTNCYTITGDTGVTIEIADYDYGVMYDGTLYAPEGATVSLNLSYDNVPSGQVPVFYASSGQLSGTGNPYTLVMDYHEDATIGAMLGLANVAYLDADGVQQTCPAAIPITSDNANYPGGWFVVESDVTFNNDGGIGFHGDAHLIIADGVTLTSGFISNPYGSLTIYAQSGGDNMGVINATVAAEGLTINGGIINANQNDDSGLYSTRDDLVINSGRITANILVEYIVGKDVADIILGWRNNTDFITAGSYSCESGNVKVKAGQILTDGNNAYFGTLTADQVTAIAGQTLVPFQIGWEGNGTANAPYVIDTPEELNTLAMMVNGGENFDDTYFELGANIAYEYTSDWDDTSSEENNFTAIGSLNYCAFLGVFDGKGHAISGIRIYSNEGKQGLFGVTYNAVIRNITLTDTRITTVNEANVGGIVGVNQGTVENCHVTNTVNIHNVPVQVGGIVGLNTTDAIVRGCTSSVRLTIDNENYHGSYGGIVGSLGPGCTIEDCLAIDVINECTNSSGPIVGSDNGTVNNSYYYNCTVGSETNMSDIYALNHANNVTVALAGDVFIAYDYDGIAVYDYGYDYGMAYGGTLYAPGYAEVLLTLGFTGDPQTFGGYIASAGTLTGTENPYTLFMPYEDVIISARTSIPYIDADGQTAYCQNYTILDGSEDYISYGEDGVEAWYVVDHDVTYSGGIWIYGPANLILVDGVTLTINNDEIYDSYGYMTTNNRLTIYVQSEGTGAINAVNSLISTYGLIIHGGHISFTGIDSERCYIYSDGDLTINGGTVNLSSGNSSYSVNTIDVDGDVVINGGDITVTNTDNGHGIKGYNITINGGKVRAYAEEGSGIVIDDSYGEGTLTLGWTDESDFITCNQYYAYNVIVVAGKAFTDGEGNYFAGTLDWDGIAAIHGKTLVPFTNFSEPFNITYVTDGGTLPVGYPTTYTFGETVVLPIPTKTDNAFAGWYLDNDFVGEPITEITAGTMIGDKTFYAMWKPAKTWVKYLDADGIEQKVYATVLYGDETDTLPGGIYTCLDYVYYDKLIFDGNTTIILPDGYDLYVECMGKGITDSENGLFVNGDLTIYGQEYGYGELCSYNVQASGDVAIYGGYHFIGFLSANNGNGTITLSWTGLYNGYYVMEYLGDVVLAKAFIDDDNIIYEAGPVEDVTTINDKWLYPCVTEMEVSYLDANGVLQTTTAKVLYGGEEAEYPGGVYTVMAGYAKTDATYEHLHFTGDATIILPDYGSLGNPTYKSDEDYGLIVDGDLTIYGQTHGNGECLFKNATILGDVNAYGGRNSLLNVNAVNINLSWTAVNNGYYIVPQAGTVNLLKDFVTETSDGLVVIPAGNNIPYEVISDKEIYPYAETVAVSYIDENGDTHTENATVLWGNETSLDGGTYTFIRDNFFNQISFSGDTKLIVPDGIEIYCNNVEDALSVSGDLAIYGQENLSGNINFNATATGDVIVGNVYVYSSVINSGGNILIVGASQSYYHLRANGGNGIITLGYIHYGDIDCIRCNDYEGTVAIRAGQTMQEDWSEKTYSGTLTADEVNEIEGYWLYPYYDDPITLDVAGYGESDGGWVLIASPIAGSITTDYVTNLIGSMTPSGQYDFDLYRFNQSAPMEWENYHQHNNSYPDLFMLENGKGYLYANKNDVTLEFWGPAYPGSSKEVALDYDANANFAGWNLVGNPFNAPATLNKSYYKMNSTGTGFVAEAVSGNTTIDALTGVMVQATDVEQSVTFTKSTGSKGYQETGLGTLQIALTQAGARGNAVLDNAIVSFNEGDELGKFYFGHQDANIYIPQNHKEYAIAYADHQTEIPVNFKATKNGEYTLTVSITPHSSLLTPHLIDNLTGANIALLETPSYTFNARTSDYASRFKLVFSEGDADADENFAFIDANGNIIINGGGIVQIIDMLGHIIVERRDGACTVSTDGMAPGVYVLRLINREKVKTQKIVVD